MLSLRLVPIMLWGAVCIKTLVLVMFIKPVIFTKPQSISTGKANPSIFTNHQSKFTKHQLLFHKGSRKVLGESRIGRH